MSKQLFFILVITENCHKEKKDQMNLAVTFYNFKIIVNLSSTYCVYRYKIVSDNPSLHNGLHYSLTIKPLFFPNKKIIWKY